MDQKRIVDAIKDALESEGVGDAGIRHDIAFHLTDWLPDLQEWYEYCQSPESLSASDTVEMLIRFLVHVPNHVAAASKLLTDIPVTDVFGVGATHESEQC